MIRIRRKTSGQSSSSAGGDGVFPEIPAELKWVLMLLLLMFMPQKSSWFEFATRPEQAYAEMRLLLPGKTIVIGKNSGSRKIALLAKTFEMHACLLLQGKNAFLAHVPGTIPPGSYSVAILSTAASEAKPRVRLDDDSEFEPEPLRVTTPIDEDQYVVAAFVVMLLTAAVTIRLRDYYREDNAAMTGRRS